jgi:hypothetical protein
MTVKQLIERLKAYPQDAEVFYKGIHFNSEHPIRQLSWDEGMKQKEQGVYLD